MHQCYLIRPKYGKFGPDSGVHQQDEEEHCRQNEKGGPDGINQSVGVDPEGKK
jgi:hypothetical protein